MRVWFAAAIPPNSQGGVHRNMLGLSEGLRAAGHEVRMVYARTRRETNYLVFAVRLLVTFFAGLPRLPDYIIARSTDGCLCALVSRILRLRTRAILHNHGWEERVHELGSRERESNARPLTTWKSKMLRFPLLRATFRMSRMCLCGTLDDIRWLRNRYPNASSRLRYVPNGVAVPEPSAYWPSRDSRPLQFLCVGGSPWRKNMARTIDIFAAVHAHLPQARLVLVGTGVCRLEELTLPPEVVEATVNVPGETLEGMADWYRRCPYMITSTRYEGGHALTVLEAMSFGCIVFASAIASTREILRHRHNGILLSGENVEYDADTIRGVIGEPSTVKALGYSAFATAQRNRWERQGRRLVKVLELDRDDGTRPRRGRAQ